MKIRPAIFGSMLKRIFRIKRRILVSENFSFYIDPVSDFGLSMIRDGFYENELRKYINSLLGQGDTFIDLGANEGYFSILASKAVGGSGKVICIEPQSRLRQVIHTNISINSINNILHLQYVISNINEIAELYLAPSTNTGSSGLTRRTKYKLAVEIVPSFSLDRIFNLLSLSKVKLIKIDVEGHEHEVIFGSTQLFKDQKIENIALEYHPNELLSKGSSVEKIDTFLKSCGYIGKNLDGFVVYSISTQG